MLDLTVGPWRVLSVRFGWASSVLYRGCSMSQTSVTVVVPVYNGELLIARCLESVFRQSYCGDIEVVVVDDGSTDRTVEVVEGFKDSRISVISQKNQGPAAARNAGIERAKGQYLAFLDADDYWEPGFLEHTVGFLDNHREAIAVSTGYCKRDWDGRSYIRPVLDAIDRTYYKAGGTLCPDFYQFWATYRAVLTGTVVMRTAIAIEAGGQRTDLRLTEDLEFWGYLATYGGWGFIPKPLFVTDEEAVTPKERLAKFQSRFLSFRDFEVEEWLRRIQPRLAGSTCQVGFERFLGHIATTVALANAYTFRFSKSYHLAKKWRPRLDLGLGSVLKYGSYGGPLLWPLVCLTLRFREVAKAYWLPLFKRPAPETSTDG